MPANRKGDRRCTGRRGFARLAWGLACIGGAALADAPTPQRDLVFDRASPLAQPNAVLERMSSPLEGSAMRERLDALRAQGGPDPWPAIDLANERFELFLPQGPEPDAGFGLVVFVPPWEGQGLPAEWLPVLQRHRVAAVTAARSGNAQDVGVRRVPLALHALENVRARWRIDPARVYAAGFSGGSRVALRLAVAWPDVFRGALLNAGSDPLGGSALPLPPAALLGQLERSSRLVQFSGALDAPALAADRASRRSAMRLCIGGVESFTIPRGGHEPAGADAFERALRSLEAARDPAQRDPACSERRARLVAREARAISALVEAGKHARAARELRDFDARWGRLAEAQIRDLAARLAAAGHPAMAD